MPYLNHNAAASKGSVVLNPFIYDELSAHTAIPVTDIAESEEEAFSVQHVPRKGKGLVATRSIKRGELLFAEPPLFALPTSPSGPLSNSSVLVALSECTREQQRVFFTLSNSHKGRFLPALGIFESNALFFDSHNGNVHHSTGPGSMSTSAGGGGGVGIGGGPSPSANGALSNMPRPTNVSDLSISSSSESPVIVEPPTEEHAGLFLLAARFNSSCTPNVSHVWDPVLQAMLFRTLRDVEEGEELCFNYCDVLGTRDQRREDIMVERNFECRCDVCELGDEESRESDERRSTISRLFEEVAGCGKEPTLGMRKIKKALRLLKDERLVHYETSFCYDAFQLCVMVTDFTNAKAWIRRAWEVACCLSGPDSNVSRMFKMYWANPRAHELAGTLPKATLCGPDDFL